MKRAYVNLFLMVLTALMGLGLLAGVMLMLFKPEYLTAINTLLFVKLIEYSMVLLYPDASPAQKVQLATITMAVFTLAVLILLTLLIGIVIIRGVKQTSGEDDENG